MNAKSPPPNPWGKNPMTWTEANGESAYIRSIDPKNPGKAFNNDSECFASYCRMQAKHAMRSGHKYQALEMASIHGLVKEKSRADFFHLLEALEKIEAKAQAKTNSATNVKSLWYIRAIARAAIEGAKRSIV